MAHQGFSDDPLSSATTRHGVSARFALAAFMTTALVGCLVLAAPAQFSALSRGSALVFFGIVAGVAGSCLIRHYPHGRLGACNVVTLLRAGLVAMLTMPAAVPGILSHEPGLAWGVVIVAGLALALDGLDGHLARRSGLVSGFGARFDMEVDCLLALILSVLAVQGGQGVWILLLGTMRYLFVAAGFLLPWLSRPMPERFGRKAVCVIQIATLVVILAPTVEPGMASMLAGVALAAVVWSFGRDVIWLAARR